MSAQFEICGRQVHAGPIRTHLRSLDPGRDAGGHALAQGVPWRVVQADDGTLYVLQDGARHAIVADPIGDDELNGYTDAGADGVSVLQGGAAAIGSPQAPAPPATALQFVTVQGNSPERTASVTVQANSGAACSITYTTPAGTVSRAAGLAPQSVGSSGVVTWSFLIGGSTRRGTGTVSVTCDGSSITSPIQIG